MSSEETINLKIQFGGGAELLFGNIRSHNVSVPSVASATPSGSKQSERPADITFLIQWMKDNMLKEREELFVDGETVRPGILVLINDVDWELEGEGDYILKTKDEIVFISTLHGGSSPGANLTVKLEQTYIAPRSEGPKYDASYLEELRASTKSKPPVRKDEGFKDSIDMDTELTFDASEMDGAIIENISELPLISAPAGETLIPTEVSIKAAREKRERMRKTGVSTEEDFISLTVAKRDDFSTGPHPESRLMREDDDLGEGDDDDADYTGAQERIALTKKGRKEEEKQRKKGIVELIDDADEQDEETMEWEMAQVKRAVPTELAAAQAQASHSQAYKPYPIPTPTSIPTLDAATQRIAAGISALTTSHTQNTSSIATLADEQIQYTAEGDNIRRQLEETEEKRAWFKMFHERIETVAEFLDAKFPNLEKLEEEHISLLKERFDMVTKRRMDDNEDDLVLLYGVPAEALESDSTDELGRTIPSSTAVKSTVRQERRQARSRRHSSPSDEGYGTDSQLETSDAVDFEEAIKTLKDKVQSQLFEDVKAKSFRDPRQGVGLWFGEWKEKWPEIYQNAFGDMGLVQAWEFWARVELLGWLPLEIAPRLDEFQWYSQLYERAHPDPDTEADELRPEEDLPGNMCRTMLIPRFNALISGGGFDPYSRHQLSHAVDIVEQIEASLGDEGDRYLSVLKVFTRVFETATNELESQFQNYSAVAPHAKQNLPTFDPEAISARQRYMKRVVKLIQNVMAWRRYAKERFGIGRLITRLLEVLFVVSQGGWDIGGEEMVRKVRLVTFSTAEILTSPRLRTQSPSNLYHNP
ncbi:hypothetical protein FRC17_003451 [Serendipita sp. 399]|nr:hypothetical protein FRC17_003451 [Serendipita sp. 399]